MCPTKKQLFYSIAYVCIVICAKRRDLGTQSSQLISLQAEIVNFPSRVLIHVVLPAVSKLCIASPNLWVYALPLHADFARLLPEDRYAYYAKSYVGKL
jgi:hypothetical protein